MLIFHKSNSVGDYFQFISIKSWQKCQCYQLRVILEISNRVFRASLSQLIQSCQSKLAQLNTQLNTRIILEQNKIQQKSYL